MDLCIKMIKAMKYVFKMWREKINIELFLSKETDETILFSTI